MEKWLDLCRGVKGVVFDFGGVISFAPGANAPVYRVAAKLGLSREGYDEGFRKYRHLWDGGFIGGVEMYRRIFADNRLAATDEQLRELLAIDCEGWISRLNPVTLELMRELKRRGKKLGILTNMSKEFKEGFFLPRAAEYAELADALAVSGEHRLYKPEKAIYRLMEKEIGFEGRDLLFFDDNLPNVEGAKNCGWHAALYLG